MIFITKLQERLLRHPLPGQAAQASMTHAGRYPPMLPPENARMASVLLLLYRKNEDWHTLLMERTSRYANDKHKGQISFPGGSAEPGDMDMAATALREAEEEIGIPREQVQLLGPLTDLYIPVSNFWVHPFVGYAPGKLHFIPEPNEVASLIETPMSLIQNKDNRKTTSLELPDGIVLKDVPYFDVRGHIVWGATSMIMSEFLEVLRGL